MQSILDKMDALQNGYGFFVLVSRTCFHLIKCLCEIDHFVGYSPSYSSHFISLVFCSELAANCLICLLQQKKSRFFCVTFALNIDVYVTFTYCMFYLLPNVIYFLKLSSFQKESIEWKIKNPLEPLKKSIKNLYKMVFCLLQNGWLWYP